MIIQKAWRQKIIIGEKPLYFDNDYTVTVLQQCKAYANIKKALKDKGIRFQMPFNRIHIHWDSGVQVYGSVWEAAQVLRQRRYSRRHLLEHLQQTAPWQRAGPHAGLDTARRAKECLWEFQQQTPG